MLRLLHILPSGSVGGAPNNLIRMIDELTALNPQLKHEVLVPFDSTNFISRLKNRQVKTFEIERARRPLESAIQVFLYCLKKKLKGQNIVIVTHGRGAGFVYRPVAKILRLKSVHFYRGFEANYTIASSFFVSLLRYVDKFLNRFSEVVAVGEDEFRALKVCLDPPKLYLIRNLVPKINWLLRADKPTYDFAAVGRRSYQKGFDRYIELVRNHPSTKFLWVGAEEDVHLEPASVPANLDIFEYMPIQDIFANARTIICLSRWEGCSTVLTECIVSSKPFISLACPGAGEFYVRGQNDRLFYDGLTSVKAAIEMLKEADLSEEINFTRMYFQDVMDLNLNARKLCAIFSADSADRKILAR